MLCDELKTPVINTQMTNGSVHCRNTPLLTMFKHIASLSLCSFLVLPAPVFAQQVTETDQSVEMRLGNDIYTAGANIDVMSAISGDIYAAGSQVMIKGDVGADVLAMGGNVTVNGPVNDDVRVMGGSVSINGNVSGDVIAFGGTIYIAKGSTVSGNLIAAGGEVTIEGTVNGNVTIDAGKATLNGTIGGVTRINADKVTLNAVMERDAHVSAVDLVFGSKMSLKGDLQYWNAKGELDTAGKVAGSAQFDPRLAREDHAKPATGVLAGIITFALLYSVLAASLVLILLMLTAKTFFTESAKRLRKFPWWSMLWGTLYFVATPGIILLLAITIIGLPLAAALLAIYLVTVMFAKVCAALVFARLIELKSKRTWHPVGVFFVALLIFVGLKLLFFIPILGWAICFLLVVSAYGALSTVKLEKYKKVM